MAGFTLEGMSKELKERQEKLSQLERACKEVPSGATGDAKREKAQSELKEFAETTMLEMGCIYSLWGLQKKDFQGYCRLYIKLRDICGKKVHEEENILDRVTGLLKKYNKACNDVWDKGVKGRQKVYNDILADIENGVYPTDDAILQRIEAKDIDRFYKVLQLDDKVLSKWRNVVCQIQPD